ncbi:MAG: hypothetical protein K8E66_13830 [Phycisphaerales bacterium]|nr:hypothetical protein [Phycisphaerales bacterium]
MNSNDNDDSRSVALYWDFENLHAGLMEAKYGEGASIRQVGLVLLCREQHGTIRVSSFVSRR